MVWRLRAQKATLGVAWRNDSPGSTGVAVTHQMPSPDHDPEAAERDVLRALDRQDLRAALDLLMATYGAALYGFCRRMVKDAELAADVHQTTFVQAWQGLAGFSRRSSLRTWLYGIARHRCLDALKIHRRRQRRFETVDQLPEVPQQEVRVEDELVASAFARALDGCLQALTSKVRTALLLRFEEGFSYPQMAEVCEDPPATLQARVSRALPMLRRCLEKRGFTP